MAEPFKVARFPTFALAETMVLSAEELLRSSKSSLDLYNIYINFSAEVVGKVRAWFSVFGYSPIILLLQESN